MTPLQQLIDDWKDCRRCSLADGRGQVCMVRGPSPVYDRRGAIPADICLMGEAPGSSENSCGQPFVGSAGQLLDRIVEAALEEFPSVTYCMMNLVGCFPRQQKKTDDHRPPHEAMQACRPRTERLLELIRPKLLVCVGSTAQEYVLSGYRYNVKVPPGVRVESITHPAAIVRMPIVRQPLEVKRCVVLIRGAAEEMFGCPA